jgi:hypothetical protein
MPVSPEGAPGSCRRRNATNAPEAHAAFSAEIKVALRAQPVENFPRTSSGSAKIAMKRAIGRIKRLLRDI